MNSFTRHYIREAGQDYRHNDRCGTMKFSVLMAVHGSDNPAFLRQALDSLERQSTFPSEVVVVCDGPLTEELEVVLNNASATLPQKMVCLPISRGLGAALKSGLNACSHETVARMDADDVCETNRFEVQSQEFAGNNLDVVGTFATEIDEDGNPLRLRRVPLAQREIYRRVWACPFIHPSVMFLKSAILRVGSYDSSMRTRQDYDLWYRCVGSGLRMANIPLPLIQYRVASQPKNRSLRVVAAQVRIGLRNCRRFRLPFIQYLLVFAPVVLLMLPRKLAVRFRYLFWNRLGATTNVG